MRATPIPDAVVDVPLHHAMRAYFSATDDRDETARRVYGVIGRLYSQQPEIALRVATGCKLRADEPVPFAQVFSADLGDLRKCPFVSDAIDVRGSSSEDMAPSARARRYGRPSFLVSLLLEMAEDVAVIRQGLETRRSSDRENSALWTVLTRPGVRACEVARLKLRDVDPRDESQRRLR